MKKKLLSIMLCLAMVLTMMPAMGAASYAATQNVNVVLPDGGGTFEVEAEDVSADATTWGAAGTETWLYVAENIDNSGKDIVARGDVNLILGDNKTFKCRSLALDGASSDITFYSQSYGDGMGTFIAENTGGTIEAAAIGTNYDVNANGGNITINGGNIQAKYSGGSNAALGCGSGVGDNWTSMGTITINGGNVTASAEKQGSFTGPAIGSAFQGSLNKIIINGGSVNVSAADNKAAIGGACTGDSGFGAGTIELNGGNITAYVDSEYNLIKTIGGTGWTVTSVQKGSTVPVNACYWYMVGGSNEQDANSIAELGNNHYVKISKKSEVKHFYMERFPVVQPEFDEGGTLVTAGCKAYFKCACGNYYEDNSEGTYIGKTEEELNAWKQGDGKLEEKYLADYLCYENGEMKARSRDSFYSLSYDGTSILGSIDTTTWYYIDGNVDFNHNIEVRGDVRIILADDVTAHFYHGLNMYKSYSSLTIYAQSEGDNMGALTAGSGSIKGAPCIGSSAANKCAIRIDGGKITAGDQNAKVGIGGGNYAKTDSSVTINGGRITADGYGGAAIGFNGSGYGWSASGRGSITINGGTIDAVSHGGNAAAIGADGNYNMTTAINGGTITALGDGTGPAIGIGPAGHYTSSPVIRYCQFDTTAGESAETAEKCDYTNQRYVRITRLAEPVQHRLEKEYPMWAPRFNGDNTLAEAGQRAYYQCKCGYYFSDSELTERISNLDTWKNDTSIKGGKLDHAIIAGEDPACAAPGYKEYYAKGKLHFSDEACTDSIDNLRTWKSKGGSGYIPPLGHAFTEYLAEGNILTGICSNDGCELADHKATITLTGEEFEYDGNPKAPSIENNGWTDEIPEITYEGIGETEWSGTEAPSEIGTYIAYITAGDATASLEFEIVENPAIAELLKELEEARDKCDAADAKVTELEEKLKQAETEYNQMEGDYEQQLEAKTEEIEALEKDLQQALEEKAEAEKRVEEAEAKLGVYLPDSKLFDLAASSFGESIKELDLAEFVVGGQKPYVFSGEGLPGGIEISPEGILSGKYNTVTPAGTADITVTDATGNSSTITINYGAVNPASVSGRTASLSATKYVYSGTAKKPTVKISGLSSGTDYTAAYKNNTKVGKAVVTITGKGNYTDTITKTFKIVPKKAAVSKAAPGKKKLTVKMKTKVSSTGGATYQIAYKQKGTSKWKYTTTTKQSKVIKKLKKGKRYYVKVRAYKTVSKVKYYGAWSKTKLSNKIK